ncbi:MAG TPA: glycosyltransferase, partial [Steroidobacteraceae bacterium]|nr:glycosyltransferase [Steroidobacteraceae bacterium]
MTQRQLPTIQMFWHGAPLSRMERLAIVSFQQNGHPVDLYTYDELSGVPPGVQLRDAEQILPRSALFRHRRTQSLALFADWFRYRLLFERGGIWADVDVVCLKPFDYSNDEVYAWQDDRYINNAVLGLPKGHALASWLDKCCENPNEMLPYDDLGIRLLKLRRRVLQGDRREGTRWAENGPKGLTRAARHLGYADRALPSWHFYPVSPEQHNSLFASPKEGQQIVFNGSRAVH